MELFKPRRRVCAGQSVRYAISGLDPVAWLVPPAESRYACFSVDGFVTTGGGAVSALFQRFEYRVTAGEVDTEEVMRVLRKRYGAQIGGAARLAHQLGCPCRVFAWPEDFPLGYDADAREILSIQPELAGGVLRLDRYRKVDLRALASGIQRLRGRSFASVKPLLSAGSNVECHLANATSDPWPGDLDAVIVERETGLVCALVEFKTHNQDTPIAEEAPGKYGRQDWRRFEVLYDLQDRLEAAQGTRPKLWYVAWGTLDVANHRRIKLARIEGNRVTEELLLERPAFGGWSEELSNKLVPV